MSFRRFLLEKKEDDRLVPQPFSDWLYAVDRELKKKTGKVLVVRRTRLPLRDWWYDGMSISQAVRKISSLKEDND